MATHNSILQEKLRAYKRKYYLNQVIRGSIFFLAIFLSMYLISTSVDFGFKPGTTGRGIIFFSFLGILLITLYRFILSPLIKIYNTNQQISDEEAAKQIGNLFPDLRDKLLNTIQLSKISSKENSLVSASIDKRIEEISVFQFTSGIKYNTNKRYVKYAAYPAAVLLVLLLFVPQFLTESTERIIKYNKEFSPAFYFTIEPVEEQPIAFKNEDYTVQFEIEGNLIPESIYLRVQNRKIKLENTSQQISYTFKKVQHDFTYQLEAGAYTSENYKVKVHERPDIKNFTVQLYYPDYTQRNDETINNSGNLTIPEGTKARWLIHTLASDSVRFIFHPNGDKKTLEYTGNQLFNYESRFFESQDYSVKLKNPVSENKNDIKYRIEVIKDKHPSLSLDTHQDTTLYSYLYLAGTIADDYGLSKLEIVYNIQRENVESNPKTVRIPLSSRNKSQNYFYQWMLDSLSLEQGDQLKYHVRVWDNDGINGSKYTRSGNYLLKVPSRKEIDEKLDKQAEGTKSNLNNTLEESKDLNEQIDKIQDKLKSKKNLDWQDKKQIEKLLQQKEKLEEDIKELQKQNKALNDQKERFSQPNENLKKKVEQLQKLMDDLLDEETKKLYDELKKLLEEQKGIDEVQQMMDKIENKENNIEKEIERTLELFKKMQFDYKMDDIINKLENLEAEQEKLSEETKDKSNSTEELNEKQEELNDEFDEVKEDLEELENLNDELKSPEQIEDTSQEEENISQELQESLEKLKNNQRKKASESQNNAAKKMKGLKQKMKEMQSNMEVVMLEENLEHLKDIVDNLVKVSFDQEAIIEGFKGVNQSDPRYVTLSQQQLKLRDDSRIIEDSLLSLAGRVFQIASFVTRELDAMNDHIETSLQALKDRKVPQALISQQFSMTAINNLALLLDDVLQQMQQQMSDAMGNPKAGKKGQKQKMPGLSELQKQLNQKIENLKNGQKSGRQLSEELAKLAAEQEMIRQKLKEMQDKMNDGEKGGGSGIEDAIKKMEQTEMDIVNKNITRQTIQRQQDILTRLLKAEDAMRERELDKKREAEKAEELNRPIPPQFEEYLKAKEKEVELLKTIPLKLNPYYKEEVNKYFKRLSEQ